MSGTENSNRSLTLVQILQQRASLQPDKEVYRFLVDGEDKTASLTYRQLEQKAKAIAT